VCLAFFKGITPNTLERPALPEAPPKEPDYIATHRTGQSFDVQFLSLEGTGLAFELSCLWLEEPAARVGPFVLFVAVLSALSWSRSRRDACFSGWTDKYSCGFEEISNRWVYEVLDPVRAEAGPGEMRTLFAHLFALLPVRVAVSLKLAALIGVGSSVASAGLPQAVRWAAIAGAPAGRGTVKPTCFPVGTYSLGMSIAGVRGLAEFSRMEYEIYGRPFEGEKDYNGPEVDFAGRRWKVALGTVNGKVYKIALFFDSDDGKAATNAFTDMMQYCLQRLGKASEHRDDLFFWDTSDGNVVLQGVGKTMGTYSVNLFETSRAVRGFIRAK
jgi:hypothetical protein